MIIPVLDRAKLPPKEQVHSLGMLLDPGLLLDKWVAAVAIGAYYQLWLVSQLQLFLDRKDLATVVHILVVSKLDNCNALYIGLSLKTVWKLQLIQDTESRAFIIVGDRVHISLVPPTLASDLFLYLIQGVVIDL